MAERVNIMAAREVRFDREIATMTVDLDNNDTYQLRVVTDSVGNVYVWVDHRPMFGQWNKIAEFRNGKEFPVG